MLIEKMSLSRSKLDIRTSRLLLRPIGPADVELLWPHVAEPELSKYMTWDPHEDRAETAAFIASELAAADRGTGHCWVLEHDGAFAGVIGLHGIVAYTRAWRRDHAELGYWCAPPLQGRGLMTEAGRAVLGCAFEVLGLHKVSVGCISENAASKRVIEKLGFRFLGEQRDHCFRFGRWWNHLVWEMTVDEWRQGTLQPSNAAAGEGSPSA
ncbi:MAG: GNAT family N-acetyltransferase [Deltaproteobacteria bacterium]|nr:GNAT family N-acetyltransferase [Deltaproteobacteria bacterium]